jgi:hypothetical protein
VSQLCVAFQKLFEPDGKHEKRRTIPKQTQFRSTSHKSSFTHTEVPVLSTCHTVYFDLLPNFRNLVGSQLALTSAEEILERGVHIVLLEAFSNQELDNIPTDKSVQTLTPAG